MVYGFASIGAGKGARLGCQSCLETPIVGKEEKEGQRRPGNLVAIGSASNVKEKKGIALEYGRPW
jgi:hypothetical protein